MKMDVKLISIIVPVYNVERFLNRCVKSLVEQEYSNIEIILVDDGSTDRSGILCEQWAQKDNRIEVIHQINSGLVAARKSGLALANGDYIGFVDSDDYIAPNMYSELLRHIEEEKVAFSYTKMKKVKETGEEIFLNDIYISGIFRFDGRDDLSANFFSNYILTPGKKRMYSGGIVLGLFDSGLIRRAYEQVPNECSQGEDFICLTWLILHNCDFSVIDEPLYFYQDRSGSISHTYDVKKQSELERMISVVTKICQQSSCSNLLTNGLGKYKKNIIRWEESRKNPYMNSNIYSYPHELQLENNSIAVYAAGEVGRCYMHQFQNNKKINVVAWIDQRYSELEQLGVEPVSVLKQRKFDKVIVAIENYSMALKVKEFLIKEGVNADKIDVSEPRINI